MFHHSSMKLFTWIVAFVLTWNSCAADRNWDIEPLSVTTKSSDPSKMRVEAEIQRQARDYVLTATLEYNYDIDENTFVEGVAYHSASGSDYVVVPWNMPKQTYKEYTLSHYKNIVYKNIENCSNLPHPDNVDPWPKGIYKLEKCVLNGEGLPDQLYDGYYKIVFIVTGEVEWGLEFIFKLTTKTNVMG